MSTALIENNLTPWQKTFRESGGLLFAECTAAGVSLGTVAFADKIAPELVKSTTDFIAKKFIEPHLETFENVIGTICKTKDCQPDKTKSPEERARKLAHVLVVFTPAFAAGLLTKMAMRRGSNEKLGMPDAHPWYRLDKMNSHDLKLLALDDGVHIGAMVFLGTLGAGIADTMIDGATSIMHKVFGVNEKKAHDLASMGVLVEVVPNALGFIAALVAIKNHHHR